VDEQQAEAKIYLVGIIAGVAILTPLVVWIGRALSRAIGLWRQRQDGPDVMIAATALEHGLTRSEPQHSRADLFAIMKCENNVRPTVFP
jgi:hypothetical protein